MKRITAVLLGLLMVASCNLSAQKTTLSGTLSGLPEGTKAVLMQLDGKQWKPADSLSLDGKESFKTMLNLTQPTLFALSVEGAKGSQGACYLMLEPKEKVHVDLLFLPEMRSFKITSCKGSKNVELYRQFNDILIEGGASQTAQALVPAQLDQLLSQNADVLVSAFLVTVFDQDMEGHAQLYCDIRDALVKKYPNDTFVKDLQQRLQGLLMPGMLAPDIEMADPDGNIRKLSDLRGQVVLLDFWASWCSPCRRENPNVVKMYNRFHAKGFEIFSVSLDKTREAWVKAIKDDGLVWPNHVSELNYWTSTAGKAYGISSVPSTVLIDRDGKIIARNLRGSDLERKLEEVLGK